MDVESSSILQFDQIVLKEVFSTLWQYKYFYIKSVTNYLNRYIYTNMKNIFVLFSAPPDKPVIRDGNGNKLTKILGPYKIGDKISAECSTTGGK